MAEETENITETEINNALNLQHTQGKTLTGYTYHDEEDNKEKVGFVGKYGDKYYYLKQTKDKGEKWIQCNDENLSKFEREMKLYAPQQNFL